MISGKAQKSPTDIADSSFEEITKQEAPQKEADATLDSDTDSTTPKMPILHSSSSSRKIFSRPSRHEQTTKPAKAEVSVLKNSKLTYNRAGLRAFCSN